MEEVPLAGGTIAEVVRVGDTVRRSCGRWSPAVHDLLLHLEAVGFDGAPRFLGLDEQGREVLTWIDGVAATRPWPGELLDPGGLRALASMVRDLHEAVASYRPPAGAEWWTGARAVGVGEIVIHGDLGPWNTLWRGGRPVAFIDWDFAEPASPVAELAEVAFFVTPMRDDEHCRECGFTEPPDRAARLRTFCEAYGWEDVEAVVEEAARYWRLEMERTATLGPQGVAPWDGFLQRGYLAGQGQLLTWLETHRHLLV